MDIEELPQKATLHLLVEGGDTSSTADTEILSDVSSPEHLSSLEKEMLPLKGMENIFSCLETKYDIIEKVAITMCSFKAYPNDREIGKAADAVVTKHPCLKDAGSDTGWNGWKNSIKFKMDNYRTKLRIAGCQEVSVNAAKTSRSNPEN
ncbi:unnamed protein product [Coregonus sp. 'balchen']|nr:unnamed protein product [Coregonus sp. 'balchen']